MKIIIVLFIAVVQISTVTRAQLGVNSTGNAPDPTAGLDVNFTDKGFLPLQDDHNTNDCYYFSGSRVNDL